MIDEEEIAGKIAQAEDKPTLPCKIGQMVYCYADGETLGKHIIPATISRIEIREHGIYCYAIGINDTPYRFCVLDNGRNDFEKCVAYSYDAAEQALTYAHKPEPTP